MDKIQAGYMRCLNDLAAFLVRESNDNPKNNMISALTILEEFVQPEIDRINTELFEERKKLLSKTN